MRPVVAATVTTIKLRSRSLDRGETAMSQIEATSSGHDARAVAGELHNQMCPTCRRAMPLKEVMPVSVFGVGETVYVCDVCGAETRRAAKRR